MYTQNTLLSKNDLKIGMTVRRSQLSNIYDIRILLKDTKVLPDNDLEGKLVYFGDANNAEYDKFFESNDAITPIYFNSSESLDEVVFDE